MGIDRVGEGETAEEEAPDQGRPPDRPGSEGHPDPEFVSAVEEAVGGLRKSHPDVTTHATDHLVYRGQLRGWLLTSLVLLERAGGALPVLGDEPELQQDLPGYAKAMPL